MESFSDSGLSDLADSDDEEYVPELEEMVGGEEIESEGGLHPESDVRRTPDDAGEDSEDDVAKDKEPVT